MVSEQSEQYRNMKFAIDLLAQNKNDKYLEFLENLYKQNHLTWKTNLVILKAFNKNNIQLENYKIVCDDYIEADNSILEKVIEKHIINYKDPEVYKYCLDMLLNRIDMSKRKKLSEEKMNSLLNKISQKKYDGLALNYKHKYNETLEQHKYRLKKTKLENKISNISKKIEKIEKYRDDFGIIQGYIVKQEQMGADLGSLYEIILSSGEHALLRTVETKYTSRGRFSLFVEHTGTLPVNTRGGFTQEWNVYVEVRDREREEIYAKLDSLDYYRSHLDKSESQLVKLKK